MDIVKNFNNLLNHISLLSQNTKLIIVSKNRTIDQINLILKQGHKDFGENKVQEACIKWKNILLEKRDINLHLIGKLQSNKAKQAFEIFNYIHTLDNDKLAEIFSQLENNSKRKLKYFIQVNIGNEPQKNGISVEATKEFILYCKNDLKLNIIGLMCIPPINQAPEKYFLRLKDLNINNSLEFLSMGMSDDYELAIKSGSTHLRIGRKIFEERII